MRSRESLSMHPLTPYGWSDRVAALYASASDGIPGAMPARVVRADRGVHVVALADDLASVRARFDDPPVTGDWAVVVADEFDDPWITHLLPRWSSLSRADP